MVMLNILILLLFSTWTFAAPSESQKEAAVLTAKHHPSCKKIHPFYFEIGDANSVIVSGATGNGSIKAETELQIASASKWLFSSYVIQKLDGNLSSSIINGLNFTSGFSEFSSCLGYMFVGRCFTGVTEFNASHVNKFSYGGGHMQKIAAVDLKLGNMTKSGLGKELNDYLGSDVELSFSIPQPAGGIKMSARSYATFLKKILNQELLAAKFLDTNLVCTSRTNCKDSVSTPIPNSESWQYGLGHWVESDPKMGDNAYSSPGAFGFYPWISSDKKFYGVLSRHKMHEYAYWDSVVCGRNIRKAFLTGIKQLK